MLAPRFAQSAVASLLLTIGLAAPVHAQQNKQIISGTWYEDRATGTNNSTNILVLSFAQTPTNQFLNVTNVSCSISLSNVQGLLGMFLEVGTTSGNSDLGRSYSIRGNATFETVGGGEKFYSIVTNQVFFKMGPGRFPTIEIDTQSTGVFSSEATCVIVGNLSDS
jgi:hypothetical protein